MINPFDLLREHAAKETANRKTKAAARVAAEAAAFERARAARLAADALVRLAVAQEEMAENQARETVAREAEEAEEAAKRVEILAAAARSDLTRRIAKARYERQKTSTPEHVDQQTDATTQRTVQDLIATKRTLVEAFRHDPGRAEINRRIVGRRNKGEKGAG